MAANAHNRPQQSAHAKAPSTLWVLSDTKRDQQIYKWLAKTEEIPEEVLLEALRQQSEYDARCRGETREETSSPSPAEQSPGHASVGEFRASNIQLSPRVLRLPAWIALYLLAHAQHATQVKSTKPQKLLSTTYLPQEPCSRGIVQQELRVALQKTAEVMTKCLDASLPRRGAFCCPQMHATLIP